jgi:DNA-binding transcriptional LysR family regulator
MRIAHARANMDIAQIEAFLAISRLGSVSKAAAKLHRSQPAISRRLSLLEAEIGAPLFDRIRSRMQLTEAGRVFLPRAEVVLAAAADCIGAVGDLLGDGAGTVSLAVVGTVLDRELAHALARFAAVKPGRLSVTTQTSEGVSEVVRRGEAVVGLRYFLDRGPDIACTQIGWEKMVVVAAPQHPVITQGERAAAQASWIGFTKGRVLRDEFGRLLARRIGRAGMDEAKIMTVDSLSSQKCLVEAGFGLGFLPHSSVQRELHEGTLVVVAMPRVTTKLPVCLVQRRGGYLSPAATQLMAELTSAWQRGAFAVGSSSRTRKFVARRVADDARQRRLEPKK